MKNNQKSQVKDSTSIAETGGHSLLGKRTSKSQLT